MWPRRQARITQLPLSRRAEEYVRQINHRMETSGSTYRADAHWVRAHAGAIELDEGSEAKIELALTWPADEDTTSWVVTRSRIYVAIYDKENWLISGFTLALYKFVSAYSRWESVTVAGPGGFGFLDDVGSPELAAHASDVIYTLVAGAQLPHSDPPLASIVSFCPAFVSGLHPIDDEHFVTVTAYKGRLSVQSAAGECSINEDDIESISADEGVLHISAGECQLVCPTELPGSVPADVLNTCLATGSPFGRISSNE